MWGMIIKNVLTACVTFLLLASSFAWYYQHDLIHHPSFYSLQELKQKYLDANLKIWPDPNNYMGLLAEPESTQKTIGNIIIFHGNAGSATDRSWYVHELRKLGYRVVLHEYQGYGAKEGSLAEEDLITDSIATVTQVKSRYTGPVYLIGESLGAAMASAVLAKVGVDGVLLISPWNRLRDVAKDLYWYLPVDLLLREAYDNEAALAQYEGPLAMVIAQEDDIIKPVFSQKLYDGFQGVKKLWSVPREGHNSWHKIATQDFWQDVMTFLAQNKPQKKPI